MIADNYMSLYCTNCGLSPMAILGQTILLEKIARVSLVFVDVKIWLKKNQKVNSCLCMVVKKAYSGSFTAKIFRILLKSCTQRSQ